MPKNNLKLYIISSFLFFSVLAPFFVFADLRQPDQIVTCGFGGPTCRVCDLYDLAHNVIDFGLWTLAAPLMAVALIAGGVVWLTSAGSEQRVELGKRILFSAVIGFLIAIAAWVIVNTILSTLVFKNPFDGRVWSDYSFCKFAPFGEVGIAPPPPPPPPPPSLQCSAGSNSPQLNALINCVKQEAGRQGLTISSTITFQGSHTCILPNNISCHYGGTLCNGTAHAADFALTSPQRTPTNWNKLQQIATGCQARGAFCELGNTRFSGCLIPGQTYDHVHANDNQNCGCN